MEPDWHYGRDAINEMLQPIFSQLRLEKDYDSSRNLEASKLQAANNFIRVTEKERYILDNYFRTVTVALEFLSGFDADPTSRYAKLFRAKLSRNEKILLHFYAAYEAKMPLTRLLKKIGILTGSDNLVYDVNPKDISSKIRKLSPA